MKNLVLALAILLMQFGVAQAQFPTKGFNFQGYARNIEGGALTNQSVNVQFTIYPKGLPSSPDFTEVQTTTTDAYGVFQLVIGSVSTTQFRNLKFADKDYWLKVEVKTGSSNYVEINNTELLCVPYAKTADNGVPPGVIMPFAGLKSKIPAGYLACDGTLYNSADYPALANAIGNAWGGSAGQFRVPDLRGMFLRGVSETANTDDDKTTRAAINSGGNSGNEVGSVQGESFKAHKHTGSGNTDTDGAHSHTGQETHRADNDDNDTPGDYLGPGQGYPYYQTFNGSVSSTGSSHSHHYSFSSDNTGGNETRPDNAYVYYIIKY